MADFFDSLLTGLDAAVFSSPFSAPSSGAPKSSRPRAKPVPARSPSSNNKRVALDVEALGTATPPRQTPSGRVALSPLTVSKQAAYDALCHGFDGFEAEYEELALSGGRDDSCDAAQPLLLQWKERNLRPPDHLPSCNVYTRAVVESVELKSGHGLQSTQKLLLVRSTSDNAYIRVALKDDWIQTQIEVDDIVHLIGEVDKQLVFEVDRAQNFIIVHPDNLIAATKTADAAHCTRKPILQEKFRSPCKGSMPSVYGNIVHAVLQTCLRENQWSDDFRRQKIDDQISAHAPSLWEVECDFDEARKTILERTAPLREWADRYVGDLVKDDAFLSDPHARDETARVSISGVLDIEEEILSPRFGLKGKMDMSLLVRLAENAAQGDGRSVEPVVAPLEIKTGRTLGVMEHRAQAMLYTLLMAERYDVQISSALLFYTHSSDLIRVQAARNELRGLIIARNDLAHHLHHRTRSDEFFEPDEHEDTLPMIVSPSQMLPTPIDHARSCARCYAVDACMLYRKAFEVDSAHSQPEEESLSELFATKTSALTAAHLEFYRHWIRLLDLEESDTVLHKRQIWTLPASAREKSGFCFADMTVMNETKTEQGFLCRLTKAPSAHKVVLSGHIGVNDPVLISLMDGAFGIARGFVTEFSLTAVAVQLDHTLLDLPFVPTGPITPSFRIDRDEMAAGAGKLRDNVAQLLYAGAKGRLRALVIDLIAPRFQERCERLKKHPGLNEDQHAALTKALSADDYALILGMPGTGKSQTIAALVRELVNAGKSVLLTSYTHSAVDNILLRLRDLDHTLLRLGKADKVMPELHSLLAGDTAPCSGDLDHSFLNPQVVATTALTVLSHALFSRRKFDVCIVDEASQITLPACLGPLRFADRFVLVGDHHQLPPLVRHAGARREGLDVSLFARLSEAHPEAVAHLSRQYRMNADIMTICNLLVYNNRLCCGNAEVASRRLDLPRLAQTRESHCGRQAWLSDTLDPLRAVIVVDTDILRAEEMRIGRLVHNPGEAEMIDLVVTALLDSGLHAEDLAILTPYRQQLKTIQAALQHPLASAVEIMTADRSQGRDKECVILSLVRNNEQGQVGELLQDWRRLNVCFTRAKAKLIVFGSRRTLKGVPPLRTFFELAKDRGWLLDNGTGATGQRKPLTKLPSNT